MISELTTHLWQSTLFAIAAGLLTFAFRRNRATVRYWLWLSASLKFLLPFALLMSIGSQMQWTPAAHQMAEQIATPAVSFVVEYVAQPFTAPAPAARNTAWIPIAIFVLWACGFAAITLMRLRYGRRVRAAVRAGKPLEIPVPVETRVSPGLLEPGVVGGVAWWSRPLLLLPEGITEQLTPSQLEAVLAHELCHVRRRDNLFAAIHMAVEAIFWFHPFVWWIGARLLEERERACDEEVLSLGNQPRVYADAILNVCKLYVESPLVCVSGVTGSDIKRRIEAIMANRRVHGLNRAKKFLLAAAAFVALAGPVAVGVVIGLDHVPVIRAQSRLIAPAIAQVQAAVSSLAQSAPSIPSAPPIRPVEASPAPSTSGVTHYQDRRLVAMLFDLRTMTPDQQSRVRQTAVNFIHNDIHPSDLVSVLAADNNDKVTVAQDFTGDSAALESAILKLNTPTGSTPNADSRLSVLEAAAKMLAGFPQQKSVIYFSNGVAPPGTEGQAKLSEVIAAAKQSNMAIFPIDAGGMATPVPVGNPQVAQYASSGRSMTAPPLPAGVSPDEYNRRTAYAQAKFGSTSSALARTYIRYGPPDQIDDRTSNAQNPSQIWRYNYLEDYRSNVEFEFTGKGPVGMHINYPPPVATYTGQPVASETLAGVLDQEGRSQGQPVPSNAIGGFPGGHAFIQIYPATEPGSDRRMVPLSVPLNSLAGEVDIVAQLKSRLDTGAPGRIQGVIRDGNQASIGMYRTAFVLSPGSYVCSVLVREKSTGHTYTETINFDVP